MNIYLFWALVSHFRSWNKENILDFMLLRENNSIKTNLKLQWQNLSPWHWHSSYFLLCLLFALELPSQQPLGDLTDGICTNPAAVHFMSYHTSPSSISKRSYSNNKNSDGPKPFDWNNNRSTDTAQGLTLLLPMQNSSWVPSSWSSLVSSLDYQVLSSRLEI